MGIDIFKPGVTRFWQFLRLCLGFETTDIPGLAMLGQSVKAQKNREQIFKRNRGTILAGFGSSRSGCGGSSA